LSTSAPPSTTLLVDFSGSLNEHAYQEQEIIWDNGTSTSIGYTGFNSTKEYYGFFDPRDYYIYEAGKFVNATDASDSTWSGNFLNWATMHRIDIMRKAMTGGKFDESAETYSVSGTDGLAGRGKYHVFDASAAVEDLNGDSYHVAPSGFRELIGLEQGSAASGLKIYKMEETSASPLTFLQKEEFSNSPFTLTLTSEKEFGILDYIGPSTRLALFTFDEEGNADQGAKVLHYMTDNATGIIDIINNRDVTEITTESPLAEALYTVVGYISQNSTISNNGPRYNATSYTTEDITKDPFYFTNSTGGGELVRCTQQNIIIISDGISTYDQNIPDFLKSSIYGNSTNDSASLPDEGSNYLDNVAHWAHTTDLRKDLIGDQRANIYTISLFSPDSTLLKETAKWGGYRDFNEDGVMDDNEWDNNGDGIPDNFFEVSSGSQLEQALAISMNVAISRVSSGGSASVVSTSRRGEGLLYQAVFWPELIDGNGNKITWAGDVYAYWLNDKGILYEDNGAGSPKRLASDDSTITIWYDDSEASNKRSRGCSGGSVVDGQCVNGTVKELTSVKHVWRASEWINNIDNPVNNRSNYLSTNITDKNLRYIMTWVDANNNGIIDPEEYGAFNTGNTNLLSHVDSATINWIRGLDQNDLRSREVFIDTTYDNVADNYVTWRLGDVINSSPTIVGAPAENYHLYWKDTPYGQSYADFYSKYKNRRIMVYFGANDGMLHAINGGFYKESESSYYNAKTENGTLFNDDTALDIGAEMWAYVPYNLLPHLSCLTKENYQHQYYVDLKPRVFDARVFNADDDHPDGWGTILVSGFNFGGDGSQSRPETINDTTKYFGSSYFIFDVTNPDKPPRFLGEMTFDGTLPFGFSINAPTVVATKDTSKLNWYLLFGNGPNFLDGSTSIAPLGLVVPLATLAKNSNFAFRPKSSTGDPSETNMGLIHFGKTLGGNNFKACISTGFVSVDYDFDFFVDMMYYGLVTTEGATATDRDGGIHRLKLDEKNIDPSKWAVMKMTETDPPITAAPNAAIKDIYGKTGSIWIYSGSGIFWSSAQKTLPESQWIYGIEEKRRDNSYDFAPRSEDKLLNVTNIEVLNDGNGTLVCAPLTSCNIPSGVKTVEQLGDYIQNTPNIEGWKRKLSTNERILGQPTLFGGLTNFTSFTPSNDLCSAEGSSKLYALYYRTGTAWKENVFGSFAGDYIPYVVDLGKGMGITPSLHVGSEAGARVYVQTSTGSIIEVHQPNLPVSTVKSGTGGWHTLEVD
jgi:type IV pilus assembly protein PilY1